MNLEHPDVKEALQQATSNENEEELALISMLVTRFGLEDLASVLDRENVLLCDFDYLKQQGNAAFVAGDNTRALECYTSILHLVSRVDKNSAHAHTAPPVPLLKLLVTVRANTAQVLLNLARNDQALDMCQQALKMPILFDTPALLQKVYHRLKQCQEPPSLKARLAAAQADLIKPDLVEMNEKDVSFVSTMGRLSEEQRDVAEYALQMSSGSNVLATTFITICSAEHQGMDYALKQVRSFALEQGITRKIHASEVTHLQSMLGLKLKKRKAQQDADKEQGRVMMEAALLECQETVWSACWEKDAAQTSALLSRPREWLSLVNPRQAIPYFLAAADVVAMGVLGVEATSVSKNTKRLHAGKPGAVLDLRATVELCWLSYVEALRMIDLGEFGKYEEDDEEPERSPWEDVVFERMRHRWVVASGKTEPAELEPALKSKVAKAMKETPTIELPSPSLSQAAPPSLVDVCAYTLKRKAQLESVKRGLAKLTERKQEKEQAGLSFDVARFVSKAVLSKRVEAVKLEHKGYLPVVDEIWHVCIHQSQGSIEMIGMLSASEVENTRPARLFVVTEPVPCPPTMDVPGGMRMFAPQVEERLPNKTVAVTHLHNAYDNLQGMLQSVLIKAVEARGGRPKSIALGPIGCMTMTNEYFSYHSEQSEVETFIEELGVQDQWIEGYHGELPAARAHEERPKKVTPAQFRAKNAARRPRPGDD